METGPSHSTCVEQIAAVLSLLQAKHTHHVIGRGMLFIRLTDAQRHPGRAVTEKSACCRNIFFVHPKDEAKELRQLLSVCQSFHRGGPTRASIVHCTLICLTFISRPVSPRHSKVCAGLQVERVNKKERTINDEVNVYNCFCISGVCLVLQDVFFPSPQAH